MSASNGVPTTQSLIARTEYLLDKCRVLIRGVEKDVLEIKEMMAVSHGLTEIQLQMLDHGISILEKKLSSVALSGEVPPAVFETAKNGESGF